INTHGANVDNARATVANHGANVDAARTTINRHGGAVDNARNTINQHGANVDAARNTINQHGAAVDHARPIVRMDNQRQAFDGMDLASVKDAKDRAELAAFEKSARFERILEDGTYMSGRVRARKIKLDHHMPDPFVTLHAPSSDFWIHPTTAPPARTVLL
ncbi:hypothetical protein, partial [Nocardia pseudobrasiliensis]